MTNESKKEFHVKCPRCGLLTVYSTDNKFRPFCSERCKIIDLGAWAKGDYAIPVQEMNYDEMAFDHENSDTMPSDRESREQEAGESADEIDINKIILEKLKNEKK